MNKKYIVRQQDIKDCGACCLLSIIRYYNGNIPLETIRLDTKTNKEGTTAYNLIKAAEKYGFIAKGEKLKKLHGNLEVPVIAHIVTKLGLNHFVVIYKITKKHVYIMDPGKGYKKEKKSEFLKEWTNVILLFKPYRKIPFNEQTNSLKKLFLIVIKNEFPLIKNIIITDMFITLLSVLLSYYFQFTLSSLETNYKKYILFIILLFLSFNILKIIFDYYRNRLAIYLNKNIDIEVIPNYISHLFKLPLNSIVSRTGGEILTRIQEMNSIKNLFTKVLISISLDLFLILGSSIFLYEISNKLFAFLCLIAILYVLVGLLSSPLIYKKLNDNIDNETEFNSELIENVNSIETIKNLDYKENTLRRINDKFLYYEKSIFDYSNFQNSLMTIKNIINNLGQFIITSFGIILILENELNILSLITFNYLISYFLEPIDNFIDLIPEYNLIKVTFIKACETLNIEEEKEGNVERFENGDISFQNICYSYDDYKNTLNNIDVKINKNDHVTIKGPSGSGKSTLCQLLNRNINDYKGNIFIGNINIKDYSIKTIKKNILYVSQREELFCDTIEKNITLNRKVLKKELNDILNITEVKEIINKKNTRLETIIYDGGYNLSGGERQRIILARSIVRKPQILILDESLNEVEEEREKRILKKIDKYLKNTTIIYISHKKETYFEKIIELGKNYG